MTLAKAIQSVAFILPIEIVSEANRRDHWAAKYRRADKQKRMAHAMTLKYARRLRDRAAADKGTRLLVKLTRILRPRQRHFDDDNLQSGFKAIRDGVAKALGIDDGSDRIEWRYEQAKDMKAAVVVEITDVLF